jgi:hypothetical protein
MAGYLPSWHHRNNAAIAHDIAADAARDRDRSIPASDIAVDRAIHTDILRDGCDVPIHMLAGLNHQHIVLGMR